MSKNILCGGVVGTVFIFLFDWLVHGVLLVDQYEMYASLWRPAAEMDSMIWFMLLTQAMLAFAMSYFVVKLGKRGWEAGAQFGCIIGIFLAIMAVGNYLFLPMEFTLPAIWAVSIFITSIFVGAIAGWCNK